MIKKCNEVKYDHEDNVDETSGDTSYTGNIRLTCLKTV